MMKLQTYLLSAFLVLVLIVTGCTSAGQSANAQLSDADFEKKVLEVIRKNPKVVLESLQAYEQDEQRKIAEAREKILKQLKEEPRLILRGSPVTGATNQKFILAEFSDFQCPYCAKAHAVIKQFVNKYRDEVTLTYKHFPLVQIHPQAQPAAQAAWAAEQQGKFWEYYNALFEQQEKLSDEFYGALATNLKLDIDKFNKDRNSDVAKTAVQKDVELGTQLGIRGTPTFVFNGLLLSGVPELSDLETAFNQVKTNK